MGRKDDWGLRKPEPEDLGGGSTSTTEKKPTEPTEAEETKQPAETETPQKGNNSSADKPADKGKGQENATPTTPKRKPRTRKNSKTKQASESEDTGINLDALPQLEAKKDTKSFNINVGTITLLHDLTHTKDGKRRPGTQGFVGKLANNGILEELYKQKLISKADMEKYRL